MSQLSKEAVRKIARCLDMWITVLDMCVIVGITDQEEYEEGMEELRKITNKLWKGKTKKILEPSMVHAFHDMLERKDEEDNE